MRRTTVIALIVLVTCIAVGCKGEFGVKDVSPKVGVLAGGEPVAINGSGFDPNMGVTIYFGTSKAGNVQVNGPEKMTVTTPSSTEPKKVDVRILTDNGKEFILRDAFTYIQKTHMDIRDLGQRKSLREKSQ